MECASLKRPHPFAAISAGLAMFDLVSVNPMIQSMDRSMGLATQRMSLIAANLANIDTPGYRTQDFSFTAAMKNEIAKLDGNIMPIAQTNPKHFSLQTSPSLPPSADPIRPNWERNDGNDVSLDRENVALARTQSAYTLSASFAQQELRKIYQLIRDGVAH
jgi:flagellar basal-body rod protein FlgB